MAFLFCLQLTVTIDNARRVLTRTPFSYTKDPTVMEIKPLRSFASGGRLLSVHGTNLDSIQEPQMVVYMDDGITIANVSVSAAISFSCSFKRYGVLGPTYFLLDFVGFWGEGGLPHFTRTNRILLGSAHSNGSCAGPSSCHRGDSGRPLAGAFRWTSIAALYRQLATPLATSFASATDVATPALAHPLCPSPLYSPKSRCQSRVGRCRWPSAHWQRHLLFNCWLVTAPCTFNVPPTPSPLAIESVGLHRKQSPFLRSVTITSFSRCRKLAY